MSQETHDQGTHALDIEAIEPSRFALLTDGELRLSLPNLASAGYRWDNVYDETALSVRRLPNTGNTRDVEAVGSGRDVTLAVRALVPGEHRLVLELRRPWEDAPKRSLAVVVAAHRPTVLDGLAPPRAA